MEKHPLRKQTGSTKVWENDETENSENDEEIVLIETGASEFRDKRAGEEYAQEKLEPQNEGEERENVEAERKEETVNREPDMELPRRTSRKTAGLHSNPHNLPRSALAPSPLASPDSCTLEAYLSTMGKMSELVTKAMTALPVV